ncbi:MAG: tRNA epoxyqueuosine(34) reductase QueG [Vicinamibacterales bacterium]
MATPGLTADNVKSRARALGFDLCGIAPAVTVPELGFLRGWLAKGFAGEMMYLHRTADIRADVRNFLPSARSVVVTGTVYNAARPYSIELSDTRLASFARYAWGDDYHDTIARRLEALLEWMREEAPRRFEARVAVDAAPVQERVYAWLAGLGWIGKNTCLIDPAVGSWLLLGEIVTSLDLPPDEPGLDRCGHCTLCLDSCPTGALVEPGELDATRCISYLTIERKGAVPIEAREQVSNHVFGCDVCQEVCPWNQSPAVTARPEFRPREAFDAPRLIDLWRRPDVELREALRGSAVSRAKLRGLRRNLAVALGNSGDADALDVLDEMDDGQSPSRSDPLVEEHVDWAKRKLARRAGGAGAGS